MVCLAAADFRVSASTVLHIKEGIMYQAKNPSSTSQYIPYYLDGNKLTLASHADFLNAQLKHGDVVIDPLVQDSGILKRDKIKGSFLNKDCSLTTSCDYKFDVPPPPAATLIDALFSFGYTANAPCVGQDAAFSFAIDHGCTSQMLVGTRPGTGTQFFKNQSMFLNNGGSRTGAFQNQISAIAMTPKIFLLFFLFSENAMVAKVVMAHVLEPLKI